MSRLAFLGTPEVAAVALQALVDHGHDIALVVTEPDRRRGRGAAASPTPTKELAQSLGIPVSTRVDDVLDSGAELAVVVAFGRLVPDRALAELSFVNVHFSLLPRWRGAAPVERAILAGDTVTGVSLMELAEELDTGPVFEQRRLPIEPHETAASLRRRLAEAGALLLVERLADGVAGLGEPMPQVGDPIYAPKLSVAELEIDWASSSEAVERLVRVGRAWSTWRGRRLIIWDGRARPERTTPDRTGGEPPAADLQPGELWDCSVQTGEGLFELVEVQPEGRGRLSAAEWRRGARPRANERLGESR